MFKNIPPLKKSDICRIKEGIVKKTLFFLCPNPVFCFSFDGFLYQPSFDFFLRSIAFWLLIWWARGVMHGADEKVCNLWTGEILGKLLLYFSVPLYID